MGRFMNHKKWVVALALIATALILTHLPVSEAEGTVCCGSQICETTGCLCVLGL